MITENAFENLEPCEDKGAGIKLVTRLQKVRQLDRSIGDSLKQLYDMIAFTPILGLFIAI